MAQGLQPCRRVLSGADRVGQLFGVGAGGQENARHFRNLQKRWQLRVIDALRKDRVIDVGGHGGGLPGGGGARGSRCHRTMRPRRRRSWSRWLMGT